MKRKRATLEEVTKALLQAALNICATPSIRRYEHLIRKAMERPLDQVPQAETWYKRAKSYQEKLLGDLVTHHGICQKHHGENKRVLENRWYTLVPQSLRLIRKPRK